MDEDDNAKNLVPTNIRMPFETSCYERVLSPASSEDIDLEQTLLCDAELVDVPDEVCTATVSVSSLDTILLITCATRIY